MVASSFIWDASKWLQKFSTTMWTMRDRCHWLHRKRKLWYTPRNPPPRFLCLELLRLSSSHLTAPPAPTLFGVFAFQLRRSPFITGVCTPSIRCFYNSSLSILACIGKVFACCLHQEHKRLPVVQTLTVSAGNTSSPCTCCLITVPHWILRVLLHNLRVPSCNFFSPDFSLFLAYVWQQLILSQHLSKSK